MAENPHPPKAPDQENTKMHVLVSDLGGYTPRNAYKKPISTILQFPICFLFSLGVHNIVYKWVLAMAFQPTWSEACKWPEVRARGGQHAKYPRVPWSHLFCWFLGVILSHDWCNQLFFGEQENVYREFTTCCKHSRRFALEKLRSDAWQNDTADGWFGCPGIVQKTWRFKVVVNNTVYITICQYRSITSDLREPHVWFHNAS